MKKTRQEINKLIAEELQQMLESGELTEEQLQELEKGQLGGYIKGIPRAIGSAFKAGKTALKRSGQQGIEAAKKAAAEKTGNKGERIGYIPGPLGGKVVYDTPKSTSATPKEPAASTAPAAASTAPAAASTDQSGQNLSPFQKVELANNILATQLKTLQNNYKSKGIDDSQLVGKVLVKTRSGMLVIANPDETLARQALGKFYADKNKENNLGTPVDAQGQPAELSPTQLPGGGSGAKRDDDKEKLEENKQHDRMKKLAGIVKGNK